MKWKAWNKSLPWITAALFGFLYLQNREVSNLALGLCFLTMGLSATEIEN